MTTGLKHFRFGALTATASMLIGVSASAAGIYALNDPLAFTTRPVLTGQPAQVPSEADIQSSWTAPIAEAMTVGIRVPVHSSLALRSRFSHAAVKPPSEPPANEPTCTEQWHTMAQGPVGRQVTNLCPGDALLPLPADEPHATPGLTMLPTPRVFSRSLRGQSLDPDTMPRPDPGARLAMRSLDHALTGRFQGAEPHDFDRPLPDSATLIRDPAPLDWAPRVADAKTPADTVHQCNPERRC
jgi:hypothetical protein